MTFIGLLVLIALAGIAYYVVGQLDFIAQPFKKIILALLVAAVGVSIVLWLAGYFFGYHLPAFR